jgi:hypothetical protein
LSFEDSLNEPDVDYSQVYEPLEQDGQRRELAMTMEDLLLNHEQMPEQEHSSVEVLG